MDQWVGGRMPPSPTMRHYLKTRADLAAIDDLTNQQRDSIDKQSMQVLVSLYNAEPGTTVAKALAAQAHAKGIGHLNLQ